MRRAFNVKEKAFFINFKELSVVKNCLRLGSAPLKLPEEILLKSILSQRSVSSSEANASCCQKVQA